MNRQSYNHRVRKWKEQRKQWTHGATAATTTTTTTSAASGRIPLIPTFDHEQIIEDIVNEIPFSAGPIPLPLLIDTLNDLWEADGLFE
jgi:hypothetical protein